MFCGCESLEEINFSNFHADNLLYMYNMFRGCSNLKELNLSSFNTKIVSSMRYLFFRCISLKELNLVLMLEVYIMFIICSIIVHH